MKSKIFIFRNIKISYISNNNNSEQKYKKKL